MAAASTEPCITISERKITHRRMCRGLSTPQAGPYAVQIMYDAKATVHSSTTPWLQQSRKSWQSSPVFCDLQQSMPVIMTADINLDVEVKGFGASQRKCYLKSFTA